MVIEELNSWLNTAEEIIIKLEDRGNEITEDICNTEHIGLNLQHQNKNKILKYFTNSNTKLVTLQLLVCVSIKISI